MIRLFLPILFGLLPRARNPSRLPSAANAWSSCSSLLRVIPLFAQLRNDFHQIRHRFPRARIVTAGQRRESLAEFRSNNPTNR
jgi:hypothetical protein